MPHKLDEFPKDLFPYLLSPEEVSSMGAGRWEFSDGEYIIREGGTDQDLFILERGSIVIEKGGGAGGQPLVIHAALHQKGHFIAFGEMAYYAGGVRTASVRSSGASMVLKFPPVSFTRIFHKFPAFAEHLFRLSVEHLRQTTDDLKVLQARVHAPADQVEAPMGTVLFEAGAPADTLYQCLSGSVDLEQSGLVSRVQGEDYGSQGLLDLMPYLRGGAHPARGVCRTDCLLLKFGPDARTRVLSTFPEAVLKALA